MTQRGETPSLICYNKEVNHQENHLTSKENLSQIISSMPQGTNEITVVVLKSQVNKRQKVSLSKNGNNSGGRKAKKS